MSQVQQFREIDDLISTLDLDVDKKFPDFLIYDYEQINHNNFCRLSVFRQNYFEINLDITEGCDSLVDQFELPPVNNRLTFISPHRLQTIKSDAEMNESYKGYGLLFKPEFIDTGANNNNLLKDFPFFSHRNAPAISLEEDEVVPFLEIIRQIKQEHDADGLFGKEIIKNYLNILFLKAKKTYSDTDATIKEVSREQEIYDEFNGLVQKHALELRSVRAYADKLHITPKHLSKTVKKVSGQGALGIIHQTQLNYAKALLRQTPKTISEIAYELNFDNPEYFSVFFKRLTGTNPSQFRTST